MVNISANLNKQFQSYITSFVEYGIRNINAEVSKTLGTRTVNDL